MNIPRFALSIFSCFFFVFFFEWVFHGILLKDLYTSTAQLWRTEKEMSQYMPWAITTQLWFVLAFAWIFMRNYEGKAIPEGLRFGLYMGLFMASMQFGFYPYMPIPFSLAGAWVIGFVAEGLGLGVILALTYKS
ncbi:MAG: hypothetical protein VX667_03230 [Nitrospinota bacterium]|nr:hypothetical protein [Nitrospinota bacterium]